MLPKYAQGIDLVVLITEIEVGANIQMVSTPDALDGDNHIDLILNFALRTPRRSPNTRPTRSSARPTTVNPFANTYLNGSLDEVVGTTQKALRRSGYTDKALYSSDPDAMPAAIEGTLHDWIADAIRWWAKSDLATVRGFRYGTHVKPGPILRNDLYHFVPIGARIGKAGKIHANQLRNRVDNASLSVFSNNPLDTNVKATPYSNEGWAGGWMFAYSGPTLQPPGNRR
jgi:hypothetical protein